MSAPKINYDALAAEPREKNARNPGYRRVMRSLRALSELREIEADIREQASGSQDGYLLSVADRMRDALKVFAT